VPQVIALGGLDAVPAEPTAGRRAAAFGGIRYLRTTPEENDHLGRDIAHKASAARGPTAILIPRGGLSALDALDGPFWWLAADGALFHSLRNWLSPHVRVQESELHVNDPAFAAALVEAVSEGLAAGR
jgi:uncharacterized protein (UPF0261 family)